MSRRAPGAAERTRTPWQAVPVATRTNRAAAGGTGRPSPAATVAPEQLVPAPLLLVTGTEALLAERAISSVLRAARQADPEVEVHRVNGAAYGTGELAMLVTPSLFGGSHVVVMEGVEAASDALVTDVSEYLSDPAPQTTLLLRHAGGQRAKKLLDAVRAAGASEVVCTPITRDEEKLDFVSAEFRRMGRRISGPAVRALVDAVGSDLRELASACSQLVSDTTSADDDDGVRVEPDLVERYFGGRVEVTGFKVVDAAVAGQREQALHLLRHALATGLDPVPLVAAFAAKLRAMAKVSAAGRGRSADLAKELGLAPWQIDRARRDLTRWDQDSLAGAVRAVAEADTAVKGGGRDPVYAVERLVLTVAGLRSA